MTQIAENLRASEEAQEPLDASLRAKLLAAAPLADTPLVPRRLLSRQPLAWPIAAAVATMLVAWVLLSPLFVQTRGRVSNAAMEQQPVAAMMQRNIAPMPSAGAPLAPSIPNQTDAQATASVAWNSLPLMVRQVHKEASIAVQVNDPEAKSDQVAQMVKDAGGFVAENTLSTGSDGSKSANLTINVPVIQFDTVLTQIGKLGEVQSKNVTGQDITDQTSDAQQAESVLEGQTSQSQAQLVKLGKRASWEDTETARELAIQLAQARARLVLLRKLGQLSSISVSLTEKPSPSPPVQTGFLSSLHETTRGATQSLLASTGAVLSLLIWTLAYAPIWLPLALIGRSLYRRYGVQSAPPVV